MYGYAPYFVGPIAAIKASEGGVVHGEVYEVSMEDFQVLERREGSVSKVRMQEVVLEDGSLRKAFICANCMQQDPSANSTLW